MSIEKSRGIVIRAVKYSDSDKILTVFTYEKGKVSMIAKGARSAKSKFLASSQLFACSEFVCYTSKELEYMSSAQMLKGFLALQQNIEKLSAASYIAELIDLFYAEQLQDKLAFQLLHYTLGLLEQCNTTMIAKIVLMFQLKIMGVGGICPDFTGCHRCGNQSEHGYALDEGMGALICSDCADNQHQALITSSEAYALQELLMLPIEETKDCQLFNGKEEKVLVKIMNDYIKYSFDRKIKSFDLLLSIL